MGLKFETRVVGKPHVILCHLNFRCHGCRLPPCVAGNSGFNGCRFYHTHVSSMSKKWVFSNSCSPKLAFPMCDTRLLWFGLISWCYFNVILSITSNQKIFPSYFFAGFPPLSTSAIWPQTSRVKKHAATFGQSKYWPIPYVVLTECHFYQNVFSLWAKCKRGGSWKDYNSRNIVGHDFIMCATPFELRRHVQRRLDISLYDNTGYFVKLSEHIICEMSGYFSVGFLSSASKAHAMINFGWHPYWVSRLSEVSGCSRLNLVRFNNTVFRLIPPSLLAEFHLRLYGDSKAAAFSFVGVGMVLNGIAQTLPVNWIPADRNLEIHVLKQDAR